MELTILILLIAGFYLLIKGADILVKGSSSLAKRFNVREIVIGLSLVAFGTSLPEAFVNIISSISNQNEIVFGNVIGSNIFNIAVILGISALISPIKVNKNTLFKEIPFSLFAAFILFLLVNDSLLLGFDRNGLSALDGLILITFFIVFLAYVFKISKDKARHKFKVQLHSTPKTLVYIIMGFFALFIGAKLVVNNSTELARFLGVSEKLIALTIIAGGTSLPELAVSAVAVYKKEYALAVGNIIGSNIFNIFFVLGIGSLIRPAAYDPIFNIDMLVLTFFTLFLFFAILLHKDRKIHKIQSLFFLLGYAAYIAYLFYRK